MFGELVEALRSKEEQFIVKDVSQEVKDKQNKDNLVVTILTGRL